MWPRCIVHGRHRFADQAWVSDPKWHYRLNESHRSPTLSTHVPTAGFKVVRWMNRHQRARKCGKRPVYTVLIARLSADPVCKTSHPQVWLSCGPSDHVNDDQDLPYYVVRAF